MDLGTLLRRVRRAVVATPLGAEARRALKRAGLYRTLAPAEKHASGNPATTNHRFLAPGAPNDMPRLRQRSLADAGKRIHPPDVPQGLGLGWRPKLSEPARHRFDIDLMEQLNKEYESKPIVERPRDLKNQQEKGANAFNRISKVARFVDLEGTNALEIGCGQGQEVWILKHRYGCNAFGIDVNPYPHWLVYREPGVSFQIADAAHMPFADESFDRIMSFAVWEHVTHPYSALAESVRTLRPGGVIYLHANLHRGPTASHRYRHIYFPWPHLLFTDEVVEEFYRRRGLPPIRHSWVNTCTGDTYVKYFNLLNLEILHLEYTERPWDQEFYERFEDVLGRYPVTDLKRDFIIAVLRKRA